MRVAAAGEATATFTAAVLRYQCPLTMAAPVATATGELAPLTASSLFAPFSTPSVAAWSVVNRYSSHSASCVWL